MLGLRGKVTLGRSRTGRGYSRGGSWAAEFPSAARESGSPPDSNRLYLNPHTPFPRQLGSGGLGGHF